jgi:hypothetical protein
MIAPIPRSDSLFQDDFPVHVIDDASIDVFDIYRFKTVIIGYETFEAEFRKSTNVERLC